MLPVKLFQPCSHVTTPILTPLSHPVKEQSREMEHTFVPLIVCEQGGRGQRERRVVTWCLFVRVSAEIQRQPTEDPVTHGWQIIREMFPECLLSRRRRMCILCCISVILLWTLVLTQEVAPFTLICGLFPVPPSVEISSFCSWTVNQFGWNNGYSANFKETLHIFTIFNAVYEP